ncbi:PREDICTED: uncharacterized protein LOC108769310 [Trachymyrmex cornetzi]|uniref:uncharacterized protein LOC108769310 n=1 Tax=Trachymyrmex cornetzi TaxID=471704 RepID=UPI00084F5616|nr:PREDICTED: uncharacterized protein LOC108769310 [Trachymyrmex cornetzi]
MDVLLRRLHILSLRYLCTDDLVVPTLLNKWLLISYSLSLESLYFHGSGARVTIRVQSRASGATFWELVRDQRVSDDSFTDRHERESSNAESGRIDNGEATRYGDNSGGDNPAESGDFLDADGAALQTMLREMRQLREEQRRKRGRRLRRLNVSRMSRSSNYKRDCVRFLQISFRLWSSALYIEHLACKAHNK